MKASHSDGVKLSTAPLGCLLSRTRILSSVRPLTSTQSPLYALRELFFHLPEELLRERRTRQIVETLMVPTFVVVYLSGLHVRCWPLLPRSPSCAARRRLACIYTERPRGKRSPGSDETASTLPRDRNRTSGIPRRRPRRMPRGADRTVPHCRLPSAWDRPEGFLPGGWGHPACGAGCPVTTFSARHDAVDLAGQALSFIPARWAVLAWRFGVLLRFSGVKMACRMMRGPGDSGPHDRGSWSLVAVPRG